MTLARHILESCTRNLVFKRRLPAEFGSRAIYVSPSCGLRYLGMPLADVDPGLLLLVSEFARLRDVVWDVGANVGLFTFAAAHRCGPAGAVLAVEADTWLVELLRKSAAEPVPGTAPVTIVPAAVASSPGLRTFCLARRSRAASFLAEYGSSQTGGSRERQTVVAVTLDGLLAYHRPPTLLKIDVEGAELEVLEGARTLVARHRPTVLCEVSSACQAGVTAFFDALNYKLFDAEQTGRPHVPTAMAPWSTIAIPS